MQGHMLLLRAALVSSKPRPSQAAHGADDANDQPWRFPRWSGRMPAADAVEIDETAEPREKKTRLS